MCDLRPQGSLSLAGACICPCSVSRTRLGVWEWLHLRQGVGSELDAQTQDLKEFVMQEIGAAQS